MTEPVDILNYWFEGINDEQLIDKNRFPFKKWFSGGKKIDLEIKERFENVLIKARDGLYKSWESSLPGQLALIILFDQFSRNIYRDTLKMFATDAVALKLSLSLREAKLDQQFLFIERLFLYMPLMHSEDIKIQQLSVQSFEQLLNDVSKAKPDNRSYYEGNLYYAKQHFSTIERFGRFPHRNDILKRVSTVEEKEFLSGKSQGNASNKK